MFADHNDIFYIEGSDKASPLTGLINPLMSSVSEALDRNPRIFKVANEAERNQLANEREERPLLVYREDTRRIEINLEAVWEPVFPPQQIADDSGNWLRVGSDESGNRIWGNRESFREYNGAIPGNTELMVLTTQGTLGTLTSEINWDYLPIRAASGTVRITPSANNQVNSVTIAFPLGRFTSPPALMSSIATTVPQQFPAQLGYSAISATSVTFYMLRTSSSDYTLRWGAVEAL